jgi:uncharacterized membrane protein YjgN (DUF898 family)
MTEVIDVEAKSKSKFTGSVLGFIGISIAAFLIFTFTLGIATPWAVCLVVRWYADNTVIDGYEVRFDGTGMQLFGKFIIWWLLCIVTLGIYSFWIPVHTWGWIAKHLTLAKTAD